MTARVRPATGSHRPPPSRRTFSSGQRALLWAAGVLGALAIVIAVLLINQWLDKREQNHQPPLETTITQTEPAPATPQNWTLPGSNPQTGYSPAAAGAHESPPPHDENAA